MPTMKLSPSITMGVACAIASATGNEKGILMNTRLRTSRQTQFRSTTSGVGEAALDEALATLVPFISL